MVKVAIGINTFLDEQLQAVVNILVQLCVTLGDGGLSVVPLLQGLLAL